MKISIWLGAVLVAAGISFGAWGQTKISLGFVPANPESITAFVAKEEGIFAKHGLDVQMAPVALISTLPAALVSQSIQVAAVTATILVQTVDSGLDLVAIAGSSSTSKRSAMNFGIIVAPDSTVRTAKDLVGKKVAVPGFVSFMDLLVKEWFFNNGVDVKQVNFVEVALPNLPDVLRTKSVDAIVSAGPQFQRIKSGKLGYVVSDFTTEAGVGQSTTLFASLGEWAKNNPAAVKAFRAAAKDAVAFIQANPEKAQRHLSTYTRIPIEDVKAIGLPAARAEITVEQIRWWQTVMTRHGFLKSKFDPAKAVFQ